MNHKLTDILTTIDDGDLLADANDLLTQAARKSVETGKKATITITISLKPAKKRPDLLETHGTATAKFPTPERNPAAFYMTKDDELVRRDPLQQELELAVTPRRTES